MNCKHHFIIDSPDGRVKLPGKCKYCGERREFDNTPIHIRESTTEIKVLSLERLIEIEQNEETDETS